MITKSAGDYFDNRFTTINRLMASSRWHCFCRTDRRWRSWRRQVATTPVCCFHARLLPVTPPGLRSDLRADLAPLFTLIRASLTAPRRPHRIPCALQELWGDTPTSLQPHPTHTHTTPVAAWSRLDCRDCCLAAPLSCGEGVRLFKQGSRGFSGCLIKYMFPVNMKSSCSLLFLPSDERHPLQAAHCQTSACWHVYCCKLVICMMLQWTWSTVRGGFKILYINKKIK